MKTLITLLTIVAVALGAVCILQARKTAELKVQLVVVQRESEQQARELADLQASQKLMQEQRRELLAQANQLAANLQTHQRAEQEAVKAARTPTKPVGSESKPGGDKNAFGQFFSQMMDDPETRKLIREQQRMMLDGLYGPLVKKWGLTPEEATRFKDLLADNMMKGTEKATSLFTGGAATNRTEMFTALAEGQKSFDEQVRALLGDTRYAEYQDYQQTVGERTQLNQFRQQFSDAETAITDAQTEQLLTFMKEAKQSVAANTGLPLPGATPDPANMEAMLSGEGMEKLLQAQESVNSQVFERAQSVLTEEQLGAFGKFQTNQLQMMRMGMTMAKKFMSSEQPTPEAPAPPRP